MKLYYLHEFGLTICFVNCIVSAWFVCERWREMQLRTRFFCLLEATSTVETCSSCPSTTFSVCSNTQSAVIIGRHWRYWPQRCLIHSVT